MNLKVVVFKSFSVVRKYIIHVKRNFKPVTLSIFGIILEQ